MKQPLKRKSLINNDTFISHLHMSADHIKSTLHEYKQKNCHKKYTL